MGGKCAASGEGRGGGAARNCTTTTANNDTRGMNCMHSTRMGTSCAAYLVGNRSDAVATAHKLCQQVQRVVHCDGACDGPLQPKIAAPLCTCVRVYGTQIRSRAAFMRPLESWHPTHSQHQSTRRLPASKASEHARWAAAWGRYPVP